MPKPITYESPPLTKLGHDLTFENGDAFVCVVILRRMLKKFPKASEYYIEASTKQWRDGSGREIWVKLQDDIWWWGHTEQRQPNILYYETDRALDASGISKKRPVRLYFRLTYYE